LLELWESCLRELCCGIGSGDLTGNHEINELFFDNLDGHFPCQFTARVTGNPGGNPTGGPLSGKLNIAMELGH
jgi:hypothetical protein